MIISLCVVCGCDLAYIGRGRPRKYCDEHKKQISKSAHYGIKTAPLKEKNPQNRGGGHYGGGRNSRRKRECQEIFIPESLAYLGEVVGRIAILANDQTHNDTEIMIWNKSGITSDRIVGFDWDADLIKRNLDAVKEAWFFPNDMCGDAGVHKMAQLGVEIIHYDGMASIIGSSPDSRKVRQDASRMFLDPELKNVRAILLNVWIEGRGRGNSDLDATLNHLNTIDGSDQWELVYFYDYQSDHKGGPWYRTLFLVRKSL